MEYYKLLPLESESLLDSKEEEEQRVCISRFLPSPPTSIRSLLCFFFLFIFFFLDQKPLFQFPSSTYRRVDVIDSKTLKDIVKVGEASGGKQKHGLHFY